MLAPPALKFNATNNSGKHKPQVENHLYIFKEELNMKKHIIATAVIAASLSGVALAQGPVTGEREFTLAGTGTSDKDFDNSSFGISGDIGW